jgi:hypothetical protein
LACGFTFFFAALTNSQAQPQTVYTWTDENGVVHYTDTAPDNPNAVQIPATEAYRPGSSDAYPQADEAAAEDAENPAAVESYADEQRKQLAEARKASQEKQAERARLCAQARQQLNATEPSRRVYFTNDKGETERLDDEQRVAMVEEAKALVAQNCDDLKR